jgi:hypothetical protein
MLMWSVVIGSKWHTDWGSQGLKFKKKKKKKRIMWVWVI